MRYEFMTRANIQALHTLCTGNKPELAGANAQRQRWWDEMFPRGLRGWIAFDHQTPIGHVEYLPMSAAPVSLSGTEGNFLTCLWVLPQYRKRGTGNSLLAACVSDSPKGVATMAFEGDHQPASFFERFGFRLQDQHEEALLLVHGPAEVEWNRFRFCAHEKSERLAIDVMYNPECPWSVYTAERVRALVAQHPAHAEIDLWVGDTWSCGTHQGLFGGVYFNGVAPFDQPPSDDDIVRAIDNALTIGVACGL